MAHGLASLAWCLGCVLAGAPWPVLFWVSAFYAGREVAQAEYRYIQKHGGKRENCPWFCGFIPSAWNAKSIQDCLFPLAVAFASMACKIFMPQ